MTFPLNELLPHLMRPAGAGVPVFSTGMNESARIQNALYSLLVDPGKESEIGLDPAQIDALWKASWPHLSKAKVALLGVPLDTGAGIRRGAAYGPQGVRREILKLPRFRDLIQSRKILDLGDVYVNPHLLHDDMVSESQIRKCREEMYPSAPSHLRSRLAVSALSQLKQILQALLQEHPHVRIFVIGGDHSVAWPVTEVISDRYPSALGIVQPDAHTDLLSSRLGIKYCFGTWSFHANERIGKNGKMVQLGIRQTGRNQAHWESTTGVKQYWAEEIRNRPEEETLADLVSHLKKSGVKQIYFSNDIDGTDENEAKATGTPAPQGLRSEFLFKVIKTLGSTFELVAADVVEVAPDLGHDAKASEATCNLAARYALACIEQQLSG